MRLVQLSLFFVFALLVSACSAEEGDVPAPIEVGEPEVVDAGDVSASHRDLWHARLAEAGIVERREEVGDRLIYYAEGPDSGPPLLLLHAQHMDWFSYSRVLPSLAESYHVFAVSYHGHGLTKSPVERLNGRDIGTDLTAFIEQIIGEPVYVTGNSSGGLLSLWLAANKPEWVRALLLEDAPLFTSELPRSETTVAYRTFTTCHEFLAQNESDDFLLFWLESNRAFVEKQVGAAGYNLLLTAIERYRDEHPGERLEINFLPDTVKLLIRGLDLYDPNFGDAFYDGRWSESFDQADALGRVTVPTLLLHANFEILEDGTLSGALDDDDAERAMALLRDGTYTRIDAEHVVHLDKPDEFIRIATDFFEEH